MALALALSPPLISCLRTPSNTIPFRTLCSQVPMKTAADKAAYTTLIKYWGTHYVTAGLFGGESKMMSFTNDSYMKTIDTHEQGTEVCE